MRFLVILLFGMLCMLQVFVEDHLVFDNLEELL